MNTLATQQASAGFRHRLVETLRSAGGLHNPQKNAPVIADAVLTFAFAELFDELLMILPDDLDLYRMFRKAGRKDAEKAAALAAHFLPLRERLSELRDNLPSQPVY